MIRGCKFQIYCMLGAHLQISACLSNLVRSGLNSSLSLIWLEPEGGVDGGVRTCICRKKGCTNIGTL